MPVKKVWLMKAFAEGNCNTRYFKDLNALDDEQFDALFQFIDDVTSGNALKGRNKPSWLDKIGKKLLHAKTYETCNVWHYHAGPFSQSALPVTSNIRIKNLGDNVSDAVIHYTWLGKTQDELIVLGFSPEHHEFPIPSSKNNPLRSRLRVAGKYSSSDLTSLGLEQPKLDIEIQSAPSDDDLDDKKAS
ncbi:TPA: hypothetical protein RQK55_000255 [Vibrio vulnificus]|nr:hypothetical protein [Vibrio vulnificus]